VLGETGRGTAEHFGLEGKVDVVSGTFSKTFGAIGGFTGGPKNLKTFLELNSRPYIFSASLPPSAVATVKAALEVMIAEPERVAKLREHARFMAEGLRALGFELKFSGTPIIPVTINNDNKAFRMAGELEKEGIFANPVVPPAVPSGSSIIRISLMATHTQDQLAEALEKFRIVGKKVGVI
jgi:7-keto-8-aminopelargonate synthetase-like enzyme